MGVEGLKVLGLRQDSKKKISIAARHRNERLLMHCFYLSFICSRFQIAYYGEYGFRGTFSVQAEAVQYLTFNFFITPLTKILNN